MLLSRAQSSNDIGYSGLFTNFITQGSGQRHGAESISMPFVTDLQVRSLGDLTSGSSVDKSSFSFYQNSSQEQLSQPYVSLSRNAYMPSLYPPKEEALDCGISTFNNNSHNNEILDMNDEKDESILLSPIRSLLTVCLPVMSEDVIKIPIFDLFSNDSCYHRHSNHSPDAMAQEILVKYGLEKNQKQYIPNITDKHDIHTYIEDRYIPLNLNEVIPVLKPAENLKRRRESNKYKQNTKYQKVQFLDVDQTSIFFVNTELSHEYHTRHMEDMCEMCEMCEIDLYPNAPWNPNTTFSWLQQGLRLQKHMLDDEDIDFYYEQEEVQEMEIQKQDIEPISMLPSFFKEPLVRLQQSETFDITGIETHKSGYIGNTPFIHLPLHIQKRWMEYCHYTDWHSPHQAFKAKWIAYFFEHSRSILSIYNFVDADVLMAHMLKLHRLQDLTETDE